MQPPVNFLASQRPSDFATVRWQEYQARVYQYWASTGIPPPLPHAPIQFALVPASSTMPFAPAPAPPRARDATAASLDGRWANHWKAKKAKVTAGPPSKIAAAAPAAPGAPASALVPSGLIDETILTQVLDGMAEEEAFEELFGAALAPVESR